MSMYSLDIMLSDVTPLIQVCFEDNDWDDIQTKREVLNCLYADLKHMEVDDGGETHQMLDQLSREGAFNEIGYFNDIEYRLNKAGYYTYNSDNWFEVYEDDDETAMAIMDAENEGD